MADVRLMNDCKYLASFHLPEGKEVPLKIARVVPVELPIAGTSDTQRRPCVYFDGKDLGMIFNKTNQKVLIAAFGPKVEDWIGKTVIVYVGKVKFGGKAVDGLCVKVAK